MKKRILKKIARVASSIMYYIAGAFHPIVFLIDGIKERATKDYYRNLLRLTQ